MAKLTLKLKPENIEYRSVELVVEISDDAGLDDYLSAMKGFLTTLTFQIDDLQSVDTQCTLCKYKTTHNI